MAARNGGAGRWILIALASLLLTVALCCCGGGVLLYLSPSLFLAWFVQDEPLSAPVVAVDPDISQRLARRLAETEGPVRISGTELSQLGHPERNEDLSVFWVDLADDRFEVLLSVELDEEDEATGYVNIAAEGSFVLERGWFTRLTMDRFDLGPLALGPYLVGQELSADANRSLADQRAQRPQVGEALDQIERMEVRDSALELTLAPGGLETWARLRGR